MSFAAEFVAGLQRLDAERLQQSAKAAIQVNGRLSLTVEASRLMHLSDDKSIVIFAAKNGDLGAVVSEKGDKQAFELKKAGSYYYLSFKNYLQEMGIDYKNQRIVYDITALEEKIEGRTVYRFARRVLPKETKELPITGEASPFADDKDDGENAIQPCETAPAQPSCEETNAEPSDGQQAATAPASAPTAAPAVQDATSCTENAPTAPAVPQPSNCAVSE